jgi:hypothetical protein
MPSFLYGVFFSLFYGHSLAATITNSSSNAFDVFQFVDQLIGTGNGGAYCVLSCRHTCTFTKEF